MKIVDPPPQPSEIAPTRVADHELLRVIGRGSYGEVWLARHQTLGTWRAIKVVRRADFDEERPFRREFEGLRRYEPISRGHPNLVGILHVGGDDDAFFCVMELADNMGKTEPTEIGSESTTATLASTTHLLPSEVADYCPRTLRQELKRQGHFGAEETLALGRALAGALAHLHVNGLVHRDVKPSNVIFVHGVARLADIGLVTTVGDSRSFVGTEGYIPPEGPGAPSADAYALGKLLYELSTGRDRHEYPTPAINLSQRPDRERLLELNAVVHRAVAVDPRQRYPSAVELLSDLDRLEAGQSIRRRMALKKFMRLGAVGISIALLMAGFVYRFRWSRDRGATLKQNGWSHWTTNKEAWNTYVRAGLIGDNLTLSTHPKAIAEYERALALDEGFAYARAELALQLVCNRYGGMPSGPALMRAKSEAKRALDQDQAISTAWQALAIAASAERDLGLAEKYYRRGIAADPDGGLGYLNLATFLMWTGRLDDARRELEIGHHLLQGWPHTYFTLGIIESLNGRFDIALQKVELGINLQPNRASGYFTRGGIHWEQGNREAAAADWLHALRLSEVGEDELSQLQTAYREGGVTNFVEARITYLKRRQASGQQGLHSAIAEELARLNRTEEALLNLELAVDDQLSDTLRINVSPPFKNLRGNPRFEEVRRRLGFGKE